ncbi:RNA polymerase subunit sigma-24 [Arcticibacterium luteifluviistationis]|uniref:RNA polymerase subunit sigma-24 n=2 Tax=Arcticibacterium luteifluviistationis TaxID=1784714 RepID=A0A2Z4GHP6_9BACT|nr:RNA polymerase subunit sigma-24 [Arcticibacterium luteifluviistationis]
MINGSESAFSELFELYNKTLVNYVYSFVKDKSMAQDCVQDVFMDVWIYRKKLQSTVLVKPYLLSAARKRLARKLERDHIFFKSTNTDNIEFALDFTIEYKIIADEQQLAQALKLNEILNKLPARQKEAIYLRYFQGLNPQQISEILEVNYQSVNNLIHRAVVHIKSQWGTDFSLLLLLISSNI